MSNLEKAIASLDDLREAAATAAGSGGCVIRLPDGRAYALLPVADDEGYDDDNDPEIVQVLQSAIDRMDRGEGISTEEVLARLKARHKQRG